MTVKFLRMHHRGKDQKLIFIVNIFADLSPNLESSFGTQNMFYSPRSSATVANLWDKPVNNLRLQASWLFFIFQCVASESMKLSLSCWLHPMNTPLCIFPRKKGVFTANKLVTTLKIFLSPLPNSMCGDLISHFSDNSWSGQAYSWTYYVAKDENFWTSFSHIPRPRIIPMDHYAKLLECRRSKPCCECKANSVNWASSFLKFFKSKIKYEHQNIKDIIWGFKIS